MDNKHVIICADSTEAETYKKLLGEDKAEVVITDPPFGVAYAEKNEMLNRVGKGNRNQTKIQNDDAVDDYKEWFKSWLIHVKEAMRYNFYLFISGKEIHNLINAVKEVGLKYAQDIVWVKNNHVLGRLDYDPKHENVIYGWTKHRTMLGHKVSVIDDDVELRKKSKEDLIKICELYRNEQNTDVIRIDKPTKSDLHSTMKPVALISKLIIDSTDIGEKVLDPFLGSGTCLIACEKLQRICYGIEIDEHYIEVILKRYYQYKQGAVIECVNRKFDAVKELNLDDKLWLLPRATSE